MKDLHINEVTRVDEALPAAVRTMLYFEPKIMLAGGFIRAIVANEKPKDIDLFGPDKKTLGDAAGRLLADDYHIVSQTANAATYAKLNTTPVQFITRWMFDDLDKCLESFDFTIAQAGMQWMGSRWKARCAGSYYQDLLDDRKLSYTSPVRDEDPAGSLLRALKFCKLGYGIKNDDLAAVFERAISGAYSPKETTAKLLDNLRSASPHGGS